jgi:hypothetical protein
LSSTAMGRCTKPGLNRQTTVTSFGVTVPKLSRTPWLVRRVLKGVWEIAFGWMAQLRGPRTLLQRTTCSPSFGNEAPSPVMLATRSVPVHVGIPLPAGGHNLPGHRSALHRNR